MRATGPLPWPRCRRLIRARQRTFLLVAPAIAGVVLVSTAPASAGPALPAVVGQAAANVTPSIAAGTTTSSVCSQWFGSGGCSAATVYSTAIVSGTETVNGTSTAFQEVVVAGAFTAVNGATYDDLVAYDPTTGAVDTGFHPAINKGPVYSVVAGPAGSNTVYIGGAFTSVAGQTGTDGVAQVSVTPGLSTDGAPTSFRASISSTGSVRRLAYNGNDGNALYLGGQFTTVNGVTEKDVARVNATTGKVDTTFAMPLSGQIDSSDALRVEAMSLSSQGTTLAIGGPFLDVAGASRPRLALIGLSKTTNGITQTGLGVPPTLENWAAPILANTCSKEHDYVRGIDFSPDGAFLVIADTGYMSYPASSWSACDAAARFPTAPTGTKVQPTWINYTGGDSVYSVQVTGSTVYLGGHFRWLNNECGKDAVCEPDAVLGMGFAAIDANTGMALPWFHPMTIRGDGVLSLQAFDSTAYPGSTGGVILGGDETIIAGANHGFNALFPMPAPTVGPTFGSIPSGLFAEGDSPSHDGAAGGAGQPAGCLTAVPPTAGSTTTTTSAQLVTCANTGTQNWTVTPTGTAPPVTVTGVGETLQLGGQCLDAASATPSAGTLVIVDACASPPTTTQTWVQGAGNELINQGGTSPLCLTDPGSSTTTNTALSLTSCPATAPTPGNPGVNENDAWPLPATSLPAAPTVDFPKGYPAATPQTPYGPISSRLVQSNTQPACIAPGATNSPGTPVAFQSCYGYAKQNAAVQPNGTITLLNNPPNVAQCLDLQSGATASGTLAVLNTCGPYGSPPPATQVWTWTGAPNFQLVNQGATTADGMPMCLTAAGTPTSAGGQGYTANGSNMTVAPCSTGAQTQMWWPPAA